MSPFDELRANGDPADVTVIPASTIKPAHSLTRLATWCETRLPLASTRVNAHLPEMRQNHPCCRGLGSDGTGFLLGTPSSVDEVGQVRVDWHGNDPDDHRADIAQDGPQGQDLKSERGSHPGECTIPPVFPGDPRPIKALREGSTESFEAYPGQLDLFRAMAGDEMPRVDFAEVG